MDWANSNIVLSDIMESVGENAYSELDSDDYNPTGIGRDITCDNLYNESEDYE